MGLFRKNKRNKNKEEDKKVKFNVPPFDYHPKIILAWAEGIKGNDDFLDYLYENGFKELVFAAHAIRLKDEARDWLMDNGYPHFMAMIEAAEGQEKPLEWLKFNKFELFYNMAIAIEHNPDGFVWIAKNCRKELVYLTQCIKSVKDEIEDDKNDIHKYRKH